MLLSISQTLLVIGFNRNGAKVQSVEVHRLSEVEELNRVRETDSAIVGEHFFYDFQASIRLKIAVWRQQGSRILKIWPTPYWKKKTETGCDFPIVHDDAWRKKMFCGFSWSTFAIFSRHSTFCPTGSRRSKKIAAIRRAI